MRSTRIFFISLILCLAASCQVEKESDINVSSDTIELNKSAGYGTFMVITPGSFAIDKPESADWCTVTPMQGSGNTEIRVKGTSNTEMKNREVLLTVMSETSSRTVKVVQPGADIAVPELAMFPKEGDTQKVNLAANADAAWEVLIPSGTSGVTASPMQGRGPAELSVTMTENSRNRQRDVTIWITSGGIRYEMPLTQEAGLNHSPSKVLLTSPENLSTEVSRVLEFRWQMSEDPDGDVVTYVLEYTADGKDGWNEITRTSKLSYQVNFLLPESSRISWRVRAEDGNGGVSVSDEYSFSTNDRKVWLDGEFTTYEGKDGDLTGTVPVVFIGEGFVISDYEEGGWFDTKINEGIDYFFETEPYASYRNCFKAYKVIAWSNESGASHWNGNSYSRKRDTAFGIRFWGNGYNSTTMDAEDMTFSKVYRYARKTGLTTDQLRNTTVVLVVNEKTYSGTCWMNYDGSSVSLVPICPDNGEPFSYRQTMAHEAGGHGFGRLGDEYVFSNSAASESDKNNIINWSNSEKGKLGCNSNLDVSGSRETAKWKHFFGQPGYETVDYINGAQYTGGGVYKPETGQNIMIDMGKTTMYYNAPSREAIVKRIMINLGQEYDFNAFMEKDRKNQRTTVQSKASETPYLDRPVAHTPPQYMPR